MSNETIQSFTWLEYEFASVDADLGRIASALVRRESPLLKSAADRVSQLQYALRTVLLKIDGELQTAIDVAKTIH